MDENIAQCLKRARECILISKEQPSIAKLLRSVHLLTLSSEGRALDEKLRRRLASDFLNCAAKNLKNVALFSRRTSRRKEVENWSSWNRETPRRARVRARAHTSDQQILFSHVRTHAIDLLARRREYMSPSYSFFSFLFLFLILERIAARLNSVHVV